MDSRECETQCGRRLGTTTRLALGAAVTQPKARPGLQRPFPPLLLLAIFCLTSCQTLRHRFLEPAPDWQSKIGQLQYRGPKTSLIGEVLVRYSSKGDFELTFSKGPGVILLFVQQNDKFLRVSGPLARGSWSGPPNETPVRLRGWASLRDLLLRAKSEATVRETFGPDSFAFAF